MFRCNNKEEKPKEKKHYYKGRVKTNRIWIVQHEDYQPYVFSNHTSALEHGRFIVSSVTHNYDGTKWIEPNSYLCIIGYNVNDIQSPAYILTENLFNAELIWKNNEAYEADH